MLRTEGSWNDEIADEEKDFQNIATLEEQFDAITSAISRVDDEITRLYDSFDVIIYE